MKRLFLVIVLSLTFIGTLSFRDCKTKPRLFRFVQLVKPASESQIKLSHGFEIETRCSPGHYRKSGNAKRTCLDGRWSGYYMLCVPDTRCPDPGSPVGGSRQGINFNLGFTVTFRCGAGLVLDGESELECIAGKNWSAPIPACKREISCDEFGALPNAEAEAKKRISLPGYSPGDAITYTCHAGHTIGEFTEDQTINCLSDGTWDTQELGKCEPVKCEPPRKYSHILITPEKEIYEFNEKVVFSCEEGYQVKGLSVLTCAEGGDWHHWEPQCEVIRCPDPGRPEHARRIGNTFLIGDNVTFVCEDGFVLKGSEDRSCLTTRQWSGELTICDAQASDCPDPGIPIGSSKEGDSYNFGDTVTYVCDGNNFITVGNTTRVCLRNREWSGRDNFCKYKHGFDDPTKAGLMFSEKLDVLATKTSDSEIGGYLRENITLPEQNISLGRALDLSNTYGLDLYLVVDVSGSMTNESLAISKEFCKRIVHKVGVSEQRSGTRITLITFAKEASAIVTMYDKQSPEFINSKIDEMQSQGTGATNLNAAVKMVRDFVATKLGQYDQASHAAIIITDGRHNLMGDPTPIAKELQSEPYSVDMYAIGIGPDVDIKILKNIANEDQYMRLQKMEDLSDVIWEVVNNDTTADRYGECGVGGLKDSAYDDIESYQEAKQIKNWPWMTGLYFQKNKKFKFACGASLINSEWLLSAAHCFVDKGAEDVARWQVKFGDLQRGINKGNSILWEIKEIIKHPNYTRVPHELHDLVLLRLFKPIVFLPEIRPVCLPNQIKQYPDATFDGDWYDENGNYFVTGWGGIKARKENSQNNVNLSPTLKYIFTEKQSDDTCKAGVPDDKNLVYEGIYCAGNGRKLDSCKGDSGGPSVREVKLKNGVKRIFQVGVVSFGYGCQQEDKYGFYVRLEDYMDWILSIVKETDSE